MVHGLRNRHNLCVPYISPFALAVALVLAAFAFDLSSILPSCPRATCLALTFAFGFPPRFGITADFAAATVSCSVFLGNAKATFMKVLQHPADPPEVALGGISLQGIFCDSMRTSIDLLLFIFTLSYQNI